MYCCMDFGNVSECIVIGLKVYVACQVYSIDLLIKE